MATSKKMISNGLWFDSEAEEAAKFYTSLFPQSSIQHITHYGKEGFDIHGQPEGKVMMVIFDLCGTSFQAINGGPVFEINPSISYFVVAETMEETDNLWNALSEGGKVLMPLQRYDWSERYGWLQDRYGLTWQISYGKLSDVNGQKITPTFLFVGDQFGRAEEAIEWYAAILKGEIDGVSHYEEGPDKGKVAHAQFRLNGQTFMAMDGPGEHAYTFNEGVSIIIECDTQKEIDFYWSRLTADGGQEGECGWLKDKFGVSWQISPTRLGEMMLDPDKRKTEKVTQAFLRMKKFNIAELERAFAEA